MKRFPIKRRILIVGEGRETEYNYFVGFRKQFERDLEATATRVIVKRGKGGNAPGIVRNAIKELVKFKPDNRYGDRVFVLLDTEGPGRAPELPEAEKLAKKGRVDIVYSCPAFEYWLLCHFAQIPRRYFNDCAAVVAELDKPARWGSDCKSPYHKGDRIIFDRLSPLLGVARVQAMQIDRHHLDSTGSAIRTNPSTQVYELVAVLTGARTGEKCPIAGKWQLVGNPGVEIQLNRDDEMPTHNGVAVHWRF